MNFTMSAFILLVQVAGRSGFSLADLIRRIQLCNLMNFTLGIVLWILEQAAGHLQWKVDHLPSQPGFGARTSLEAHDRLSCPHSATRL